MNARFRFKQFSLDDTHCGMKIGTDGVLLGAWARLPEAARRVADVGCGCGLIALMLAQRYPDVIVEAIDIDAGACVDANANAEQSPWPDRVMVRNISFADMSPCDAVVSNPPFFLTGELASDAARAGSRHAGALSPFTLISRCASILPAGGSLSMITPADYRQELVFQAALDGMSPARICTVFTREGRPESRILWEFVKGDALCEETTLAIRDSSNNFTKDYINLTKDFYL